MHAFTRATLVLPDRVIADGTLLVADGRITAMNEPIPPGVSATDLGGAYLAPGFIDLHVHGGDAADFMDLTADAFRTVARCHARHGTTSLTPTSTVAAGADYGRFLDLCDELRSQPTGGARILGGHLYGPYFLPAAKGCHPALDFLPVDERFLRHPGLTTLTLAPELPGAEALAKAACARGLLVTAGHSYATFPEVEAAVGWGVRHVDHLFCAMSDRARLRQVQAFPMRAGVMEATLFFDELSTEVIADGWHLSPELLRLAFKAKGPDRLALVSDAMRAVDCPDGEYWFGPAGTGERIRRRGDVGVTLDGTGLASGVMGMDHCLRTMLAATRAPLWEVVRMATLTPARILGVADDVGSLAVGQRADFVVLDTDLQVQATYVGGETVFQRART